MRIKPLVIAGAVVVGASAAIVATWLYACRQQCNPFTNRTGTDRPFTTRVDNMPSAGEYRLLELLRHDGWPVDTDETRFGTYDGAPAVLVRTPFGIAELQMVVEDDGDNYMVAGYGTTFGGEFRTDVLPDAMLGAKLTFVDFEGLEAMHRPDEKFLV